MAGALHVSQVGERGAVGQDELLVEVTLEPLGRLDGEFELLFGLARRRQ